MLSTASEYNSTTITHEQPVQLLLPVLLMMLRCTLIDNSHIGVMIAVAAAVAAIDKEEVLRIQHTLKLSVPAIVTVGYENWACHKSIGVTLMLSRVSALMILSLPVGHLVLLLLLLASLPQHAGCHGTTIVKVAITTTALTLAVTAVAAHQLLVLPAQCKGHSRIVLATITITTVVLMLHLLMVVVLLQVQVQSHQTVIAINL
jgi:hypothetical protein